MARYLKEQKTSRTHFIAVASGKGGVGKSTFSANLANILSQHGYKVALFDADMGLANLDVMLNVKIQKSILHVLKGECSLLDIIIPISKNLILIPGESGDGVLKYKNNSIGEKFFQSCKLLDDLDFMIIDTGAGIGSRVKFFLEASDEVIVVTIPDPASITDSYALIKSASKIKDSFLLVLNMVKNQKEAENIFSKIQKVSSIYLKKDLSLTLLGKILKDENISKSIKRRSLFTNDYPYSKASTNMQDIARALVFRLEQRVLEDSPNRGFGGFVRRLVEYF